eukprot:181636-Chlamydomonas_euryale.AAC.1
MKRNGRGRHALGTAGQRREGGHAKGTKFSEAAQRMSVRIQSRACTATAARRAKASPPPPGPARTLVHTRMLPHTLRSVEVRLRQGAHTLRHVTIVSKSSSSMSSDSRSSMMASASRSNTCHAQGHTNA